MASGKHAIHISSRAKSHDIKPVDADKLQQFRRYVKDWVAKNKWQMRVASTVVFEEMPT